VPLDPDRAARVDVLATCHERRQKCLGGTTVNRAAPLGDASSRDRRVSSCERCLGRAIALVATLQTPEGAVAEGQRRRRQRPTPPSLGGPRFIDGATAPSSRGTRRLDLVRPGRPPARPVEPRLRRWRRPSPTGTPTPPVSRRQGAGTLRPRLGSATCWDGERGGLGSWIAGSLTSTRGSTSSSGGSGRTRPSGIGSSTGSGGLWTASPEGRSAAPPQASTPGAAERRARCGLQRSDPAWAKPAARRAVSTAGRAGHPARWSSTRPHPCISARASSGRRIENHGA
jgi:hypothetical protein